MQQLSWDDKHLENNSQFDCRVSPVGWNVDLEHLGRPSPHRRVPVQCNQLRLLPLLGSSHHPPPGLPPGQRRLLSGIEIFSPHPSVGDIGGLGGVGETEPGGHNQFAVSPLSSNLSQPPGPVRSREWKEKTCSTSSGPLSPPGSLPTNNTTFLCLGLFQTNCDVAGIYQ